MTTPTERPEPDDLEIVWQLADKRGEELQRLHRTLKKIATGKFSKDQMRMMAWEAIKDQDALIAVWDEEHTMTPEQLREAAQLGQEHDRP